MQLSSIFQKDDKNNDRLGHANRIYGLKSSSEHPEILLSGAWDETVFIWDTRIGRHVEYIYGPLICGESLDVKGDYILSGSWRNYNQLQIWDVRNKKHPIDIPWVDLSPEDKNKKNHIYVSQFTKTSDRYIIAGTTGANEIRIFDKYENYQCVDVITGFQKPVYTLNFNHLDQKIAFGSGNGVCGVIEV
jgi:WD40 repeat protein